VGVNIGVLALQGNVSEHIHAFRQALAGMGHAGSSRVSALRTADGIKDLDAIAIPGGESTTISRLIMKNGMYDPLVSFSGGIFATCAGMVLMAAGVDDERVVTLGLMDMDVTRNAFGRQKESFEADIPIQGFDTPFHAIFIRAPVATRTGPVVGVIGSIDAGIVAVEQGTHMALAFHPELGNDYRLHERFINNLI
jgi:5'-phosphate synthase pdxT subunit